jgi:hypothetical protein
MNQIMQMRNGISNRGFARNQDQHPESVEKKRETIVDALISLLNHLREKELRQHLILSCNQSLMNMICNLVPDLQPGTGCAITT